MLGLINLVSDARVLSETQKFANCFDEFKATGRGRDCNTGAMSLAKVIRESVSSEWQIYLPSETIAAAIDQEREDDQKEENAKNKKEREAIKLRKEEKLRMMQQ